jgi:hypothetical protein
VGKVADLIGTREESLKPQSPPEFRHAAVARGSMHGVIASLVDLSNEE